MPLSGAVIRFIALALLACAIPWAYRRAKPLLLAASFFVLFLAPTYSPLVVGSLAAERYAYVPGIGLAMARAKIKKPV